MASSATTWQEYPCVGPTGWPLRTKLIGILVRRAGVVLRAHPVLKAVVARLRLLAWY